MNKIYKFDVNTLFDGDKRNNTIICSETITEMALEEITKRNSLLFDQIFKLKCDEDDISDIICVFDFSDFKRQIDKLSKYENGFVLSLPERKRPICFKDFLKSNSMSKECQAYYINSDAKTKYGENLYQELINRTLFDFHYQKTAISKLYAYSGTLCSECTLLDDIKLNPDEIIVVKDLNKTIYADCITMVSKEFLYEKIVSINNDIEKNYAKILTWDSCRIFESIYSSLGLKENEHLSYEIKDFIQRYINIDKTSIEPFKKGIRNILSDYSSFDSNKTNGKTKWERIKALNYPFNINIFDGEGLISFDFANELIKSLNDKGKTNKYEGASSFQIRLPYIKGMVHSCDFKGFFKEKNKTVILNLYDSSQSSIDINKVKMIITESMFKAGSYIKNNSSIKNIEDYINTINKYDYPFGVVNTNKKEEDNNCVLEYQFLSTIPFDYKSLKTLYSYNKKYMLVDYNYENDIINSIKSDINGDNKNVDLETLNNQLNVYEKYRDYFINTSFYRKKKSDIFNRIKRDACFGKINIVGQRRYLSSDLLAFLYYIAFNDSNILNFLSEIRYYMPSNINSDTKAVLLRSPHYSRNEIVFLMREDNNLDNERKKYFSHLTGVVMINPKSLASERLGGADYDGDTVLVASDYSVVNNVIEKIYEIDKCSYKYLPCKIPSLKGIYKHSFLEYNERMIAFKNTFSSRIGELSNAAFKHSLQSYHTINSDYNEMAEYTILNGVEIDSTKCGRKPELLEILNRKETNHFADAFLNSKNEYDKFGTLSSYRTFIDIVDVNENNEKLIDFDSSIDDYEYNSSDYYKNSIFSLSKSINSIRQKNDKVNRFCDRQIIFNRIDKLRAISIKKAYQESNSIICKTLNQKSCDKRRKKRIRIYKQIEEICEKHGFKSNEIFNLLQINNIESYRIIKEYVNGERYHFMTNDNERNEYIKLLLSNYVDCDSITKYFSTFENDGFRLLFLYLNYQVNNIDEISFSLSADDEKSINQCLNDMDENDIEEYSKYKKQISNNIDEIFKSFKDKTKIEIKKEIIDYLKKEASAIKPNAILDMIYDSNLVFNIFYNQLIYILEKEYDKKSA